MGIIVRYILRELGLTFLFGFAAFTCLLLAVGLIQRAIENHIPLIYVWQLIPFVFADMSTISLPVTLLLATTIFFSKMSGNNEVIALKALGVPPKAFLLPVFMLAFFVSLVGVWINDQTLTWGREGISTVIYRGSEDILIEQLRQTKQFDTRDNQITIRVQGVDEQRRLIRPTIILRKDAITIEAQTAQITMDFSAHILTATLDDVRVFGEGGMFEFAASRREEKFLLSEIVASNERLGPSSMGLKQIQAERQDALERIEQQRRIIAAHRTFSASMGSVDDWKKPEIEEAQWVMHRLRSDYARLSVEPPRRWATGFCCFFFVWLGAPLAIWMRKSDFFSSFFACFVPILIVYYPLLMLGLDQAKKGGLPPMSVWIANTSIGIIGLWFLRQIHRY